MWIFGETDGAEIAQVSFGYFISIIRFNFHASKVFKVFTFGTDSNSRFVVGVETFIVAVLSNTFGVSVNAIVGSVGSFLVAYFLVSSFCRSSL